MSVIFGATSRMTKKSSDIAKRDMSMKTKVIRKVCELGDDGVPKLTTSWVIELNGKEIKVTFSRDNLHVWVNGVGVKTTAFITDKGYDVDLFFEFEDYRGQIYSDVEGKEMMNYLLLNDEIVAQEYQKDGQTYQDIN
ncbi:hypothetical protein CHS0354_023390 [Potamilus streckersoni]|uniref:Uncharacterized protein n=1 Tax=Potamilus streckersoni TaxID=2493646 RepID=A0AAE0T4V0_9BIVA|nr:hypothetical protein CHS0354_023390 [Potamilus streckersoni]